MTGLGYWSRLDHWVLVNQCIRSRDGAGKNAYCMRVIYPLDIEIFGAAIKRR